MGKIKTRQLTQPEVDALLRALSGGKIGNEGLVDAEKVIETLNDYSYLKLPRLERILDNFSRIVTNKLTKAIGVRCEINPLSIDRGITLETVLKRLPVPTGIFTVNANIFSTPTLCIQDSRFIFSLVDEVFGGGFSSATIEGREFTKIEKRVIDIAQNIINDSLSEAWSTFIVNSQFFTTNFDISSQYISIVEPEDKCIVISYDVELGINVCGLVQVIPEQAFYPEPEVFKEMLSINSNWRLIPYTDEEYLKILSTETYRKTQPYPSITDIMEALNKAQPFQLNLLLKNEHPQTLACILYFLDNEIASKVILNLPYGLRSEIIKRIEKLELKNTCFLEALEVIKDEVKFLPYYLEHENNNTKVSEILSQITPEAREEIEKDLKENE